MFSIKFFLKVSAHPLICKHVIECQSLREVLWQAGRVNYFLQNLSVLRVCLNHRLHSSRTQAVDPELVVLDDKLAQELADNTKVILESSARRQKHLRLLITLADSLANYARTQLHENPSKALEKLKELEK